MGKAIQVLALGSSTLIVFFLKKKNYRSSIPQYQPRMYFAASSLPTLRVGSL